MKARDKHIVVASNPQFARVHDCLIEDFGSISKFGALIGLPSDRALRRKLYFSESSKVIDATFAIAWAKLARERLPNREEQFERYGIDTHDPVAIGTFLEQVLAERLGRSEQE